MNAYLHIPFCTSICSYCDFTSFAGREGKMSAYVEALCLEIGRSDLAGPLQTAYFGGGTPSLLPPPSLARILEALDARAGFAPGAEISLEANPETVEEGRLASYRSLGVNRLSFGAQALQKEILKRLGRGHDWTGVERAFRAARAAGFENVNLDLMFGLPGQDLARFRDSLGRAADLGPEHFSLYALQVEEGTPLARQAAEGLALPGEEETAEEYAWAQEFLARRGFEQYEVSNFAKPGFHCRHNWNVWRGEDYWGFGVSAVGTVGRVRHSHGEDLEDYLRQAGSPEGVRLGREELSDRLKAWERLMLGLRTREGVARSEVERYAAWGEGAPNEKFRRLLREGFLLLSEGRYRVSAKGYFVLNGILEALAA